MGQTRRLAAILAVDVAGYSLPIGANEEGTLGRLRALCRKFAGPQINERCGWIVKTARDGVLLGSGSRRGNISPMAW
jgi:hypothetical protein